VSPFFGTSLGEWPLFADIVEKAVKYSPVMGKLAVFRRRVGRVVWAAPGPPSRALCGGQHFRKPIDRSQAGEAPEVLSGGGEEKFVLGSVWSSQTQTGQTKDSLEVGE
jgi:hypothetical protein